jgi:hypothetical protein
MRGKQRVRTTIGHYPALSLADARRKQKSSSPRRRLRTPI